MLFLIKRKTSRRRRKEKEPTKNTLYYPVHRVLRPLLSAHHSITYRECQVPQKLSDTFVYTSATYSWLGKVLCPDSSDRL